MSLTMMQKEAEDCYNGVLMCLVTPAMPPVAEREMVKEEGDVLVAAAISLL